MTRIRADHRFSIVDSWGGYAAEPYGEGENFHPMMKVLEEAELELKCIAFEAFDFTNPESDDHCAIHNLPVGQGLTLP